MSENEPDDTNLADALLAAGLFAKDPLKFGGIVLRGSGPVRDRLVQQILANVPTGCPVVKIPLNVDTEQLLGGLDLAETLANGQAVQRQGLLERASGGIALVPMAERVSANVAAHLAQAMDGGNIAAILQDDGLEPDETPPLALMERAALHCDLGSIRTLDFELGELGEQAHDNTARALTKKQRSAIAATAAALGVHSIRPFIFAEKCAGLLARFKGAERVTNDDLQSAISLVLSPRATQIPEMAQDTPPPPEPPAQSQDDQEPPSEDQSKSDLPLDDLLLEAAQAAIPQHILDGIEQGNVRSSGGQSGRSGEREKSAQRGRPLGSVAGTPGDGRRLSLVDTLRAAAPWQKIRRPGGQADTPTGGQRLAIRKSDLRVRRFEQNRESLIIFAVDASGSSALSRLAEAKGAVELMLAEAHVKRSQVALIAFRQAQAEILLPPTRSLTRARRVLSGLPGGGGTPLAAGLQQARLLADSARKRGQTPTIAFLTDGKANVTLSGEADRAVATKEVEDLAKGIAASGHHAVVIDISPRPREEASALADALRGKYLPLPHANSAAMVAAIESVGERASA